MILSQIWKTDLQQFSKEEKHHGKIYKGTLGLIGNTPLVEVVHVEPEDSPVLSEGRSGSHKIQGIGAGFVPDVLNTKVYDEVLPVKNDDAFAAAKKLAKKACWTRTILNSTTGAMLGRPSSSQYSGSTIS